MNITYSRLSLWVMRVLQLFNIAVGKSCSILQFINNEFKEQHDIIIGVEYERKEITFKGMKIKLYIWDTVI